MTHRRRARRQAQFLSVLSDLTGLQIRGEFITGPDNGDLDNVTLGGASVPEPSTLTLAGLALLGIVLEPSGGDDRR